MIDEHSRDWRQSLECPEYGSSLSQSLWNGEGRPVTTNFGFL